MRYMNRKKTTGVILCCLGVGLARLDAFIPLTGQLFFVLKTTGILIAFTGLAFFGSGLKKNTKKIKACPECFTKNDAKQPLCKKCKQPLTSS